MPHVQVLQVSGRYLCKVLVHAPYILGTSLRTVLAPHCSMILACAPCTEYDYSELRAVVNSRRVGRSRHARTHSASSPLSHVPVHQSPITLPARSERTAPCSPHSTLRTPLIAQASRSAYGTPSYSPALHSSRITLRRPTSCTSPDARRRPEVRHSTASQHGGPY